MRSLIGTMSAIALLLATVSSVSADDFGVGPPDGGWFADDGTHSFCFDVGMNSDLRTAVYYAMGNSIDYFTDMTDQQHASCEDETDIVWVGDNLPGTARGATACLWRVGNVCRQSLIILDQAEIDIGANDQEDRYKTACHEAGHSVGLTHSNSSDDCMRNGAIPDTSPQYRNFNTHHRAHINTRY